MGPMTLMAGSLPRTPFPDLLNAAAQGGFDAVTIWPSHWRHAMRRLGLGLGDLRGMAQSLGIEIVAVEAVQDWVPERSGPIQQATSREEMFHAAGALSAGIVVALHFGADVDLDRDAAGLAALSREAGDLGLQIALEPVSFSQIPNLRLASDLVEACGESNTGLVIDTLHMARAGDDFGLTNAPLERIVLVQLADGSKSAPLDPVYEAMFDRLAPGDGELEIHSLIGRLGTSGVLAPIGPEVFHHSEAHLSPAEVATALAASCIRVGLRGSRVDKS